MGYSGIWLLLCALLPALAGCGVGTPTGEPTPAAGNALTAEEIIQRAREAAAAVTSYQYVWDMTRQIERPGSEPSMLKLHEEGRWLAPSDFFADTLMTGDVDRHYQEISVDGTAYARYLPGDGWRVHGPFQRRGVPNIPGAADWQTVGRDATFDGEAAYHLTGIHEMADHIQVATSIFDVYLRKGDLLPLFVDTRFEGQTTTESGTEHYVTSWATRYFAFNEPVTIAPPSDATPAPTPRARQ